MRFSPHSHNHHGFDPDVVPTVPDGLVPYFLALIAICALVLLVIAIGALLTGRLKECMRLMIHRFFDRF